MSKERNLIYKFIKDNQPIEQSKIVEYMMKERKYTNKVSARNSMSSLLKKLESSKFIRKTQIQKKGHPIPSNLWSANAI